MTSIVITGGIGCGKSVACSYIEKQGFELLYADEIARSMTEPGGDAIEAIAATFGKEFILDDGSMDRSKMRDLVYRDNNALDKLQKLTTYAAKAKIDNIIKSSDSNFVFIEVPLLFELNSRDDYDYSWLITADLETRIARIIKRDGINREQALDIINAQMPEEKKIELADEVVYNDGSVEDLYKQIDNLLFKYQIK